MIRFVVRERVLPHNTYINHNPHIHTYTQHTYTTHNTHTHNTHTTHTHNTQAHVHTCTYCISTPSLDFSFPSLSQRAHLRKHMATSPPPGGYLQKPNLYLPSRSVSTNVKCSSCSLQGGVAQWRVPVIWGEKNTHIKVSQSVIDTH